MVYLRGRLQPGLHFDAGDILHKWDSYSNLCFKTVQTFSYDIHDILVRDLGTGHSFRFLQGLISTESWSMGRSGPVGPDIGEALLASGCRNAWNDRRIDLRNWNDTIEKGIFGDFWPFSPELDLSPP